MAQVDRSQHVENGSDDEKATAAGRRRVAAKSLGSCGPSDGSERDGRVADRGRLGLFALLRGMQAAARARGAGVVAERYGLSNKQSLGRRIL